jgi:hypothetical protein
MIVTIFQKVYGDFFVIAFFVNPKEAIADSTLARKNPKG